MTTIRLVLGSGSPQRRRLLSDAGYRFDVLAPDDSVEDCGICTTGGPAELVTDLSMRKAANVASKLAALNRPDKPTLIIACDTVAECAGSVLGKPKDEDHALDMLQRLRGTRHRVLSGLTLWPLEIENRSPQPSTHLVVTELAMDAIDDAQLHEYLESGLWRGKAGAFGYQDRQGWMHVLQGSESNVIGLPMELLTEQLSGYGVAAQD